MNRLILFMFLILVTIAGFINQAKADPLSVINTISHHRDQIVCMADNMYHEAKNQGRYGMRAVGSVTLNRVGNSRFPDTPCEVIKQKARGVCQFSWVCSKVKRNQFSKEYKTSLWLSVKLLYLKVKDVTDGSLFFHANYVKPYWSKKFTKTVVIGDHVFYKATQGSY